MKNVFKSEPTGLKFTPVFFKRKKCLSTKFHEDWVKIDFTKFHFIRNCQQIDGWTDGQTILYEFKTYIIICKFRTTVSRLQP